MTVLSHLGDMQFPAGDKLPRVAGRTSLRFELEQELRTLEFGVWSFPRSVRGPWGPEFLAAWRGGLWNAGGLGLLKKAASRHSERSEESPR